MGKIDDKSEGQPALVGDVNKALNKHDERIAELEARVEALEKKPKHDEDSKEDGA